MHSTVFVRSRLPGFESLALACGATDDALSWCILATVLAIHRGSIAVAATAIIGGIVYTLLLLTIGRRILRGLRTVSERHNEITAPTLSTVLILPMACAWFTDAVGSTPSSALSSLRRNAVRVLRAAPYCQPRAARHHVSTAAVLRLFGLQHSVGLLKSPKLWAVTLGILALKVAGKGIACTLAARLRKVPFRESVALGALMNARGLIELILLNIGLQAGIITPTLFTILVLVAVVTTLMATPVFEWVYGRHRETPENDLPASVREGTVARNSLTFHLIECLLFSEHLYRCCGRHVCAKGRRIAVDGSRA
jgi:hypothetical protein